MTTENKCEGTLIVIGVATFFMMIALILGDAFNQYLMQTIEYFFSDFSVNSKENISTWVRIVITILFIYGLWTTKKIKKPKQENRKV